jgi:hypothetical protein
MGFFQKDIFYFGIQKVGLDVKACQMDIVSLILKVFEWNFCGRLKIYLNLLNFCILPPIGQNTFPFLDKEEGRQGGGLFYAE